MPTGPVTPSSLIEDLGDEVEFLVEVAEERGDAVRLGSVYEQLCAAYRALGICLLSGDGDVDGFFGYLIQSSLTRLHYLQAVRPAGGGEARYRRASFVDPAFDAIATRQWRLAGRIFAEMAPTFTEGEEYEDDFCYADFIRRLVDPSPVGVQELLAHWEDVLEGGQDRRLDVAKALVGKDPEVFADMLRALLDDQETKARAIADPVDGSIRADEITFFPNRWISVEGLALLALAERQNMTVSVPFPACPPLARVGIFGPFRSKGFPHVSFVKE
jgi:hypothetical protein